MKKRSLLVTALIVVMLLSLTISGCATIDDVEKAPEKKEVEKVEVKAEEPQKEIGATGYWTEEEETYYMVTFVNGHPYWVGCYEGAVAAAANLGSNIEVKFGGTPEYDINEAVTSFEQIAATKPAGILLACMNPEPFVEAINKAMADGVPVVTYDTDSPNSDRLAYASTDNVFLGGAVLKYIVEDVMGTDEITVGILGRPGQLNLEQRIEGFRTKAGTDYPGVNIVAEVNGEGDIVKATTAASAMILANPDIDVIFSSDGIGGPGAAQACEELGREDIKIVCVDSSDDVLAMIEAGKIHATVAQNTYNQGYWAMMMMYSYTHDLVDPFTDWRENDGSPLPPYINTGVDFLTKGNVAAFSVE